MLPLIWDPDARGDLRRIYNYIAELNPRAADRLRDLVEQSAERLPEFPYLHRVGRIPGTREVIVHPNYILIYRVEAESVRVVAVFHARQRYP